jgi:hypothetical protein
MAEASPRLGIPIPSEFEEPYYQTAHDRDLQIDAGIFANAENSQLQFLSEDTVGWDADAADALTGILFWNADIEVTAFSTPFKATIAGPASIELQDGEVLFFRMPRLLRSDTPVQLYRSNRIFLEGTKLHDLRLFCARIGTTLYFYNGLSLKDEDQGQLFGGGLISASIFPPHEHQPPLIIEPPSAGIAVLDALATLPDLAAVQVYRNGALQANPDDYTIDLGTGLITLVVATVSGSERFVILREFQNTTATTTHDHLTALVITPPPATALLDMLVTSPTLDDIDLFRGGLLQVSPADYSLDLGTGFVTLVVPTVGSETFVAHRRINI